MKIYRRFKFVFILMGFFVLSGCVFVRNASDNIIGNYLNSLERCKESGKSRVVDYSVEDSFERVVHILDGMDADIMRVKRDDYSILALVSGGPLMDEDSVESTFGANSADVGIFFVKESPKKTRIYISCLSELVLERTADTIFSQL